MTKFTTYFSASIDGEFRVGDDSLVGAVLEAAAYDGWGVEFARLDEGGEIDPAAPMQLFQSSRHLGNNPYFPKISDSYGVQSSLPDDDAAMGEVAAKVASQGMYFGGRRWEFFELVYEGDILISVDGKNIESLIGAYGDTVSDIRAYFL